MEDLKKFLKSIWQGWKKFGLVFGNIVSTIFLVAFYFSLWLIFAVPFKIAVWWRERTTIDTFYAEPAKQFLTLKDFQDEY